MLFLLLNNKINKKRPPNLPDTYCACGNTIKYTTPSLTACTYQCSGSASQICGSSDGIWFSVYSQGFYNLFFLNTLSKIDNYESLLTSYNFHDNINHDKNHNHNHSHITSSTTIETVSSLASTHSELY